MTDQPPIPPPDDQELSTGGDMAVPFDVLADDADPAEPTREKTEEDKAINALVEQRRANATKADIASRGIQPDAAALAQYLQSSHSPAIKKRKLNAGGNVRRIFAHPALTPNNAARSAKAFDLISSLSSCHEIIIEVCKHLRYTDILKLYSVSKVFHSIFDTYMQSSVTQLAQHFGAQSTSLLPNTLFPNCTIPDPAQRPAQPHDMIIPGTSNNISRVSVPAATAADARQVPSLRYLALVMSRERMVRDILACLARQGHRLPASTASTLRKMWLVMDVSSNGVRRLMMRSRTFTTNEDLYNMNIFFVKMTMRLTVPLYGRGSDSLLHVLLGQESGLREIWRLLRGGGGGCSAARIMQMKVRYNSPRTPALIQAGVPLFGVPIYDVGVHHLEGWGRGRVHLMRPDELLAAVAAHRGIRLDAHARFMVAWGYRDLETGANAAPTREEMYMSDDELPPAKGPYKGFGNVPFREREWQPHHAMKARWGSLTMMEKLLVWAEQEDEKLRAEPYGEDTEDWLLDAEQSFGYYDSDESDDDDDEEEAAGLGSYTGPKWNAVNKVKILDRELDASPQDDLRQQAQAIRRSQLTAHDRNKVDGLVDSLGRVIRSSEQKLKKQANQNYTDEEYQAWDDYIDSLGDDFWNQAHAEAGDMAGSDAVRSARHRNVLQPLAGGHNQDDDHDVDTKDDDGDVSTEEEQLENFEGNEAIYEWEKKDPPAKAAATTPRKQSWTAKFEDMDLEDGDGEEEAGDSSEIEQEECEVEDEQDDEYEEGSSDKENESPDGDDADNEEANEGVEDILGQLRILRLSEANRLVGHNAGGTISMGAESTEAERRQLMKKLEREVTRDVFSWSFRRY